MDPAPTMPDPQILRHLVRETMPFGKYAGRRIVELPEDYLLWFEGKGFPEGRLGQMLAMMLEIRKNGLEGLLEPLG